MLGMKTLAKKVFGTTNDRKVKAAQKTVDAVAALEPEMQALSDGALKAKTQEFRDRLAKGETLDQLLPEAFAVVREASVRTLGLRPFDVQVIGGLVLHQGSISEMKTGEGKTLVATMPVYLNALEAKGVHVVTVNDYLAKRDAEWMGAIYNFLGHDVSASIVPGLDDAAAQGGLCLRHHLRDEQRTRLRLSPRQHEVPPRRHGAASAIGSRSSTRSIRSWSTRRGRR